MRQSIAAFATLAVFLASTPAMAMTVVGTVVGTDDLVTITNSGGQPETFLIRIHDGSAEFTLEPGHSREFASVNASRADWAVWQEGLGLIANGAMVPLVVKQTAKAVDDMRPAPQNIATPEANEPEAPVVLSFLIAESRYAT